MASQLFLVEKESTTKTKRPLGMAERKIALEEAQHLIRGRSQSTIVYESTIRVEQAPKKFARPAYQLRGNIGGTLGEHWGNIGGTMFPQKLWACSFIIVTT